MARISDRETITQREAADYLGVSTMTISRMCHAGEIRYYTLTPAAHSPRRIYTDSVVAFAQKRQGREAPKKKR
jgi:excisionase family DNA binding protein